MSIVVVGGDHLGGIDDKLRNLGFTSIHHVNGRKTRHVNTSISRKTDFVLVLTDYVRHDLCEKVKKESKNRGIKLMFAKRSWSHIQKLSEIKALPCKSKGR